MPLHDWNRIPAGLFHHFHQDWSIEIARELNRRRLPQRMSALVEELTYRAAWNASPGELRWAVEIGLMPQPDAADPLI